MRKKFHKCLNLVDTNLDTFAKQNQHQHKRDYLFIFDELSSNIQFSFVIFVTNIK